MKTNPTLPTAGKRTLRSHQQEVRHIPCHYFSQCGKRATHIWKPKGYNVCKMHAAALIIMAAQDSK